MTAARTANVPWLIVASALGLLVIGLTGIERADALSEGLDLFPRQMTWVMLGAPLIAFVAAFPYRRLQPWSALAYLATLPLLILVFWMPLRNGARCWIPLGVFDLQPSELTKLAFILALADYLSIRDNYRRWSGLLPPFLAMAVPVGLILKEPDLGSAMLFVPVLFGMLFAAGARLRHLVLVVLLGLAALPVFWWGMNAEQKSRITSLFNQQDGGPAPEGDGYHQHQAKLVLSLGGVVGSEFGGMPLDDPDAYHLPAGQTDFVFCWVGERWGLCGGVLTLLLYALLFAKGLQIAAATREPFGRLVAVGIVTLLASQAIINAGMTVGLMPIAGITLPLMSYGGSSLLSTCAALGLLMNIGMRPTFQIAPEPFRFTE
ncbi:MAG: FtsW/RodA/SpoVE family cell cycle protein [Planctomycetaceae bacterium]|nr:FtsW/RodA/SpoVE family cell cycle protein [Planctomycetaceae bacterium]